MLDLLRKHDRLMDKISLDDADRDDWERLAKLVEEKFKSTNSATVKCPFYKYTTDECKMGFGGKCKPVACMLQRSTVAKVEEKFTSRPKLPDTLSNSIPVKPFEMLAKEVLELLPFSEYIRVRTYNFMKAEYNESNETWTVKIKIYLEPVESSLVLSLLKRFKNVACPKLKVINYVTVSKTYKDYEGRT